MIRLIDILQGINRIISTKKQTTLRWVIPQWQGGNFRDYYFGSHALVVRLLQDVAAAIDMAITEYMPWGAIGTRNLLRKLPLLAD